MISEHHATRFTVEFEDGHCAEVEAFNFSTACVKAMHARVDAGAKTRRELTVKAGRLNQPLTGEPTGGA